jgi:antitoxin VapB
VGIFIKNPDVERKARELAKLTGQSLTAVIGQALDRELAAEHAKPRRRPTLEEIRAATDEFRRLSGLDKTKLNVTRADFDALWEVPGLHDDPEFS